MIAMGRSLIVLVIIFLLFFQTTFEQQPARLTSWAERSYLLQLRSSLGLRTKEWPKKSDPCSIWVGILCENGSVIGINISGFRRTRIGSQNPQFAVDALANLTRLVSFNASRFSLPGSIPDWLGFQLQTLRFLDLRFCEISGAIPFSFGNLSNLNELYLSDNILTGTVPSSLGQLSRLSVLDLSNNAFTGLIPSSLGYIRNLSFLEMSSNYLSGVIPEAFGNLSNLRFLNLSSNSLSSTIPTQISNLTSLIVLDLSFNSFFGSLPLEFGNLRNLQRLLIHHNLLSGNLSVDLFQGQSQLQNVVLDHNNFTGDLPDALWLLPNLSFLDVSTNNFTGSLPNHNLSSNATTIVFNLSHNTFYGSFTAVFRRVSSVDLSYNYLQGTVPDYANGIASLNRNCLRNTSSQRSLQDCETFYSIRGLPFDNFGLPNGTMPPPQRGENRNKRVLLLAAILGGVGLIVLVILVVVLILCCRKTTTDQRGTEVGPVPATAAPPPPGASFSLSSLGESFTYQQILAASGEFSNENFIKKGHSGDIFRGVLEGGIPIIIKRFDVSSGKDGYLVESDFFRKVSHPRLVPLVGHCSANENEKFLIYKYMKNEDLSSSLYRKSDSDDDGLQSLDWITRLKIATGAAEGLSYLHHECTPPLVHRDVQASSILLDDKYEVRLGSLSEVCTQEGETHSNRFTRLLRLPQTSEQGASGAATATCAYDVYCFGKVLLELVTGKLGISASSDSSTKELLDGILPYINICDKELVTNIVDPSLIIDEDLLEEVWAMAVVARSCLNPKPSKRPLMRYILKALENPLKVVREESSSSARLRTPSSRGSWNAALFGSWRHSSSDVAAGPAGKGEGTSRMTGSHSQGSGGHNGSGGGGGGGEHSSRRHSKDVFPEPLYVKDEEKSNED